jgi:hypothetical protein
MRKPSALLIVCGAVQVVLGLASLFAPGPFFVWMGLESPPPGNQYMIGMLGARFLAYGIALFLASRQPEQHRLWIAGMALIQAIDLAVGLWYTAIGVLSLEVTAFPMTNAAILLALLLLWGPWRTSTAQQG